MRLSAAGTTNQGPFAKFPMMQSTHKVIAIYALIEDWDFSAQIAFLEYLNDLF